MLRKLILLLLGLALGGAIVLAQRRAKETGKTFLEALPEVPGDARRLMDEVTGRVREAVNAGKEAAGDKQAEIQSYLDGNK